MKILKMSGVVILLLGVLILAAGLVAPKEYRVERSAVVNAPRALVFNYLKYWNNWAAWSPWAERDATMTVTVSGRDGEPGSEYAWTGDPKDTGRGRMVNTGVTDLQEMTFHLEFMEPWKSESDGYVRVAAVPGGTEVTWGFYGKVPYPVNLVMLVISMDSMTGPDFERGLMLLKKLSEDRAALLAKYPVTAVTREPRRYAMVRETVTHSEIKSFYERAFMTLMTAMQAQGVDMTGAPTGLYYAWTDSSLDMAAAVPVGGDVDADGVETVTLPGGRAFTVDFYGDYSAVTPAHEALEIYLLDHGETARMPIMEEYVTDPMQEPDTTKWLTRIYHPVEE